LHDHVVDTALMVGAIPARFGELDPAALETYLAMARGN
jgi:5-methyltetrahydropteroyltriglutamate--homocysteine methyltransferase